MTFWLAELRRFLPVLAVCLLLAGCFPPGETALDEQKDPNFIEGKNRVHSLDHKGATESFEKALQANPNSASAHFELGVLYEQRFTDYPAAIYHYEKFLQLRPKSDLAEVVRSRSTSCKMEMAKTVSFTPITEALHKDLERVGTENGALRVQMDALRTQLAQKPTVVTNFSTRTIYVTNVVYVQPRTPTNPLALVARATNAPVVAIAPQPQTNAPRVAATQTPSAKPSNNLTRTNLLRATSTPRGSPITNMVIRSETPRPPKPAAQSYTVQTGETFSVIARRFGLKPEALTAANPQVDPRRLKPGQVLVVPLPGSAANFHG